MFRKRNKNKDLLQAFKAVSLITSAETIREADLFTGYAVGVIEEKCASGKISGAIAESIITMTEGIGEEIRKGILNKPSRRKREREKEKNDGIIDFDDYVDDDQADQPDQI